MGIVVAAAAAAAATAVVVPRTIKSVRRYVRDSCWLNARCRTNLFVIDGITLSSPVDPVSADVVLYRSRVGPDYRSVMHGRVEALPA